MGKLKKEMAKLEECQRQLQQLRHDMRQKDLDTEKMRKEQAAAATTLAEANQLVVQLTERLRQEEEQRFGLCERLVAAEERLNAEASKLTEQTHGLSAPTPMQTRVFINPVATENKTNRTENKTNRLARRRNSVRSSQGAQSSKFKVGGLWDFNNT